MLSIIQMWYTSRKRIKLLSLHSIQKLRDLEFEEKGLSLFTGLDYWTGILDWTTGLKFFPFLDKIMWFFKYLTPGDLN